MKCPFCSQEIKESAKFCAKCGNEIPRCPSCGKVIYRRTRFCTNDGAPLPEALVARLPDNGGVSGITDTVKAGVRVQPMQPEKKKNGVFILVAVFAFLAIATVSGVVGYTVMNGGVSVVLSKVGLVPKESDSKETVAPGLDDKSDDEGAVQAAGSEKEDAGGTVDGADASVDQNQSAGNGEQSNLQTGADNAVSDALNEEDYSDIDVNAVDNERIEVSGTVKEQGGQCILKLEKACSVCAYDSVGQVDSAQNVRKLVFSNEQNMESYCEAKVSVAATLSADSSGQFVLDVIDMEVDKEPPDGENAYKDHTYEIILGDVNWKEAFDDCIRRGGYLVRINSENEFQYIIDQIEREGMQKIHFYLGGKRSKRGADYYWVDKKGKFTGEVLNPDGGQWCEDYWMENEPSFEAGGDEEMYMNLIYFKDNWVLNDVPLDITKYYAGVTAYICEYDK